MSRWQALPEAVGSRVAIGGELIAAAALSSLMIWRNGELIGRFDSPVPNPGRLAVVGNRVHWGTRAVDTETGEVAAGPLLSEVLPGYAQTAAARSPDGSAVLLAGRWGGLIGEQPTAAAALVDGGHSATLWQVSDVAPDALWCGDDRLIVGCRMPAVFDRSGQPIGSLPLETPPFRIDGDQAGTVVLVGGHGRLVVGTADGSVLATADGQWLDAALAPDGRSVLSVDLWSAVNMRSVEPGLPVMREVPTPDRVIGIGVSDSAIVAAFGVPPAVRVLQLDP
jgi:hypothetical protein